MDIKEFSKLFIPIYGFYLNLKNLFNNEPNIFVYLMLYFNENYLISMLLTYLFNIAHIHFIFKTISILIKILT